MIEEVIPTYKGRNYAVFMCDPMNHCNLPSLRSFRAEWDGKEQVFEEDCLSVITESLQEALGIAEKVAAILDLTFPHTKVSKQLEIYRWEGIKGQEVIIKGRSHSPERRKDT